MWENFKLDKILENRNKIVKWNTVTNPLNLSCQGKKGFFFFPEINVLLICQHLMLWRSHPPLPLIHTHSICINFCTYICMFIHKDSRTSTHTNTHWCREHKENCFRINYFILPSRSHFWIGVLMLLRTLWDVIGQFLLQIELPSYYAWAPSP